jgi:PAS domain S-box-containing protein
MLQTLREQIQSQRPADESPTRWLAGPIWLALAVAVGYFLSARLSLFLLAKPDGVAVFWPAAGLSSGLLIAFGRQVRWPVAIGTIAATIAANLTSDRDIWSTIVFGLCNAGESLFVAWLIERYFGSQFSLGGMHQVLGLLAAAVTGAAASGVPATAAYRFLHSPDAPVFTTWWHWFASDAIGIVTVAPSIIGFASTARSPPPRQELVEGVAALALVVVLIEIIIFLPPVRWGIALPVELLFPVLIWVAARCAPVFTAVAVFVVSLAIVFSVTFQFGLFNYLSTDVRILGAQGDILGVAIFAYVLAALFAERRQHEATVIEKEERLEKALAVGGVAAFDWDVRSDLLHNSESAAQILGVDPQRTITGTSFLTRVHPDDRALLEILVGSVSPSSPSYSAKFRYTRPDGREAWLEKTSKAEFDGAGHTVRFEGLLLDITERQLAEEQQKMLTAELDHRVKNVLARVAVVAMSTRQSSTTLDEFVKSLDGRIQSMAAAHSLLSQSGWHSVNLASLVQSQLAPYATDANVRVNGADVMLTAAEIQAMAMVLHELGTNAAKYGALSVPGGQVSVNWERRLNGYERATLTLMWRELGGPPLPVEVQSGYGTNLIRDLVPHELGGTVDLAFASEGLICKIELPLERA